MIDQYPITTVSHIKRDIFIRLFSTCAAVPVPGFYRLTIAHQGSKALSQAVNCFANAKIKPFKHIIPLIIRVLHVAVIFHLTTGNTFAVAQKIQ
ncbi:hypothetical protein HmCmsJML288_03190 [Escherichia coli]|nr:hypothetical protein HmCmsJML288_03190 [Escherichia coli]